VRATISEAGVTDARPPFRYSLRTRAEFADTDMAGVVYYGRFAHLCDRASVAYRRHLGIPAMGAPGHLFVVRAFECEYRAPLLFDEPIEVFIRTSAIGRTSHTSRLRVEGDGGRHVADITQVLVGLEGYGGVPSPVPESMRAGIEAFEEALGE
jgi:acyl-CoA thioester hydrolase